MALIVDLGAPRFRTSQAPTPLEVEAVSSWEDLQALQGEWRWLWARCPSATTFQRPEWLVPWYRHFGPYFSPRPPWVVTLRSEGRLVGLAPLAVREENGARVVRLLGEGLSDNLDVLMDPELAPHGVRALFAWLTLHGEQWDTCVFEQLREDSPLLHTPVPPGWGERTQVREVHSQTALPWAPVGQLASHLRQARRQLEQLGPVRLEEANPDNLEALLDTLVHLHGSMLEEASLQSFHREVARGLLTAGALRLCVLRVAERPVAVFHGFRDKTHVRYYLGGGAPDFARYDVNGVLLAQVLEEAGRSGATLFDFPKGRVPAGFSWGSTDTHHHHRRSLWHGPEQKV